MNDHLRREKTAKRVWVSVVIGLLGLQIAIGVYAVSMATSKHAPVVLPDYHQAALDWDKTRRNREAIDQLGWRIGIEVSDAVDDRGVRALQIFVIDDDGNGVDGLNFTVNAYHHAKGRDVKTFTLQSLNNGMYEAATPLTQSGLWHVELVTHFEGTVVNSSHTLELN